MGCPANPDVLIRFHTAETSYRRKGIDRSHGTTLRKMDSATRSIGRLGRTPLGGVPQNMSPDWQTTRPGSPAQDGVLPSASEAAREYADDWWGVTDC